MRSLNENRQAYLLGIFLFPNFFSNFPPIFPQKRNFRVIISAMRCNSRRKKSISSYATSPLGLDTKITLVLKFADRRPQTADRRPQTADRLAVTTPTIISWAVRVLNQKPSYTHNFRTYKAFPCIFAWRCLFLFLSQNWFIKKLHI